jgi:Zn-dependent metalloprotease
MKRFVALSTIVLVVLAALVIARPAVSQPPIPPALGQLRQDAGGEVEITWNPLTGTPSFIRGRIPLSAIGVDSWVKPSTAATTLMDRYASLFGVRQASSELKVMRDETDALGMRHVTLQQVYQGIEVYGGSVRVHLSADGQDVVAVSSGFVPDIQVPDTLPRITADQALAAARKALPNGILLSGPKLVIYPGRGERPGASAKLAWLVELRDDLIPARNLYVVDAIEGTILDVLDRIYEARNRRTYDANHRYILPGTLARSEEQGPTGDRDVDNAHDFAGATYDYFWSTHGRDSYDNRGATLISTANYGRSHPPNAYWNGTQTVYSDYLAVKDVVAHEWTHAVTEHSANLKYRWQSGALNESFSDIFGAMVDRDDWLIGEDLPPHILGGHEALRDLSDPGRFGQPDHTRNWVKTCSDNEGVHTNSGITNKAYYNIATAIGKDKAERIFYRALTVYLHTNSSLEDARAAALQSAQDLYGANIAEYDAVRDGFNAVGLDGQWNPPQNDCTCAATLALSDESVYPDRVSALDVAATLYRVRDELLTGTQAGEHYRALYEEHTGRIAWLLLLNPDSQAKGGQILKAVTPGLSHLMDGQGAQDLITQELVNDVLSFLQRLAEEDRAKGGGELADTIEREKARIEWNRLAGMTFEEAWQYIQSRITAHPFVISLPVVLK